MPNCSTLRELLKKAALRMAASAFSQGREAGEQDCRQEKVGESGVMSVVFSSRVRSGALSREFAARWNDGGEVARRSFIGEGFRKPGRFSRAAP